jgi:group I intron endonuclease
MSIAKENYCVYMHICPNNKKYIGITKQLPEKRWLNGQGYRTQKYFKKAIDKYGWGNIEHKILFTNLTKEQAKQKEIELIKKYNTNNNILGYNLTSGGDGLNGIKLTQEHKEKISKSMKGKIPYNKGKKMSAEQHAKLILTRKTKKVRCIETNEIFNSLKEASNKFQFDMRYISNVCRGINRSTHGYHFEFIGGEVLCQ